jgi:hypothetical protein
VTSLTSFSFNVRRKVSAQVIVAVAHRHSTLVG